VGQQKFECEQRRNVVANSGADETETVRGAVVAAAAGCFFALTTAVSPALAIGPVSVPFDRVTYEEVACPTGTMSSLGGSVQVRAGVACVKFTAAAANPSSKPLNNAVGLVTPYWLALI
jgi:hypothetical protein